MPFICSLMCPRALHLPSESLSSDFELFQSPPYAFLCAPEPCVCLAVCYKVFCLAFSRPRAFPVLFGVLQGQLFLFPCRAGLSLCLVHTVSSIYPCQPLMFSGFSFYCTPRALHLFSYPLNTLPFSFLCTPGLFL